MFDMLINMVIVCYGEYLEVLIEQVFLFFIDNFLI